jgi:hypothetical protein
MLFSFHEGTNPGTSPGVIPLRMSTGMEVSARPVPAGAVSQPDRSLPEGEERGIVVKLESIRFAIHL